MWTLAKLRNGLADLTNERFHTFIVKYNGNVVGELKFTTRFRRNAWEGIIYNSKLHGGMNVCFFDKEKNKVLEWFKGEACRFINVPE